MNIGIFTDTFKPCTNGVVDAVWRVAKGFQKEGHNVHLLALSDRDSDEITEGVHVHKFKAKAFKFYPDFLIRYTLPLRRVFRIVKKEKIQVIHSNVNLCMGLCALIASNKYKLPLITTFHTLIPEFVECFIKGWDNDTAKKPVMIKILEALKIDKPLLWLAKKFVWYWMRYFNTSEWLIVPSKFTKNILVKHGLNRKKIIVVPNPITHAKPSKKNKTENMILHVGRLSAEKHVEIFVKALKYVKHDYQAVITSDGPLRKYLEELARKEGISTKVKFTGFIPKKELEKHYSNAAIFVSAAEYDTFNNCVAEALTHDTPVIISRKSGATDFVKDGTNGIIVESDDPREYARKIDLLLINKDIRNTLSKAGDKIRQYTSINNVTRKIEELYNSANRVSFIRKIKDFIIYGIGAAAVYSIIIVAGLFEKN